MILDAFMDGLLFKLFLQKWWRFGRRVLCMYVAVDLVVFILLTQVGMELRWPKSERYPAVAVASISGCTFQLFLELLAVRMWLKEALADVVLSWASARSLASKMWHWARGARVERRMLALSLNICACTLFLLDRGEDDRSEDDAERAMLAVALFLNAMSVLGITCLPFQRLGVFALVVDNLISTDLPVFLLFLSGYTVAFYVALYVAYPIHPEDQFGSGDAARLAVAPDFNDPWTAAKAMVDLSFAGKKLGMNMIDLPDLHATPSRWLALAVFAFFYYLCMVLIVVLLMRLFMALLSATFNRMSKDATLAWRLQLARWVLFAELFATACPRLLGETWAGELVDGHWVYSTIQFTRSGEDASPEATQPNVERISVELAELKRLLLEVQEAQQRHSLMA